LTERAFALLTPAAAGTDLDACNGVAAGLASGGALATAVTGAGGGAGGAGGSALYTDASQLVAGASAEVRSGDVYCTPSSDIMRCGLA
jgi:hypothetical protein